MQGDLEAALRRLSTGAVRVTGAGRTDAGCHAAGQVASATVMTTLGPDRLQRALNALLPGDVRIVETAEVDPGFHARFDAMRRAYRYLIARRPTAIRRGYAWIHPVNAEPAELDQVSRPLLGSHDFTSFTRQGSDTSDAQCRVMRARWSKGPGGLRFDIESDRFLYMMVRRIVSTTIRAWERGGGAREMRAILEARDRKAAAPPAPAHGLYLMRVRYPRVGWIPKEPWNVTA